MNTNKKIWSLFYPGVFGFLFILLALVIIIGIPAITSPNVMLWEKFFYVFSVIFCSGFAIALAVIMFSQIRIETAVNTLLNEHGCTKPIYLDNIIANERFKGFCFEKQSHYLNESVTNDLNKNYSLYLFTLTDGRKVAVIVTHGEESDSVRSFTNFS